MMLGIALCRTGKNFKSAVQQTKRNRRNPVGVV
jgi:hypothetical protein